MTWRQITLRGATWNHARGLSPMLATAQRFSELHPNVSITWETRSLQAFADRPLEQLAEHFDLLVIDHPWVGRAAATGAVLPLTQYLASQVMDHHARESVGLSQPSYRFHQEQWALAIDAAAPVSVYRPDLLHSHGGPPATWDAMIALGRKGLVACPSIPLDVYGNFLNLCVSLGATIFPGLRDEERVVNAELVVEVEAGTTALELLRELASVVPSRLLQLDPIHTLDLLSTESEWAYCPFVYGYSNYARPGFAPHLLRFGEPISVIAHRPTSTMLGGTGLAVSAQCRYPELAVEYASFVAAPETQRGLYFESGGQPSLLSAWTDEGVNRSSDDFFLRTLPALERAFLRPRYDGYLEFQERAGFVIHEYLQDRGGTPAACLQRLNGVYRASLAGPQESA